MKSKFTNEQINEVMEQRGVNRKSALKFLNRDAKTSNKKAAVAPAKDVKKAAANDKAEVTITKKGLAARKEGLQLFIKAGRPSHADFRKVFGAKGPAMTWAQRAEQLGIASAFQCAEKFPSLLEAAKKAGSR